MFQLSPSDVTAFLACEHLTTLSLRAARGEIDKPDVDNEQAELVFRKGLEHERAYLEQLRAEGKTIAEIELDDLDWEARPARARSRRCATASRRRLPGRPRPRRLARRRRLPRCGSRTASTRRSTPSSRARRSPPTSSSSASTRAARADPGARAGADPRPARLAASGRASDPREFAAYYRRVRSRLVRVRRRAAADRAVPGRPLRRSATSSRSATRTGTRSTT